MFLLNGTQSNDPGLLKTTPTSALKLGDKCLWPRKARMEADYNFKKEEKNQAAFLLLRVRVLVLFFFTVCRLYSIRSQTNLIPEASFFTG